MDENTVAFDDPTGSKCGCKCRDLLIDIMPGPGPIAPDEANPVAMPAGVLGDQMRQIHDAARDSPDAAR